jgi:hypothetical protein
MAPNLDVVAFATPVVGSIANEHELVLCGLILFHILCRVVQDITRHGMQVELTREKALVG